LPRDCRHVLSRATDRPIPIFDRDRRYYDRYTSEMTGREDRNTIPPHINGPEEVDLRIIGIVVTCKADLN